MASAMPLDSEPLQPPAQGEASMSPAARRAAIENLHWIDHPGALLVLDQLNEIFTSPKQHRKPSLFLAAAPGNGKTALLQRFTNTLPPAAASTVVWLALPAGEGPHALNKAILAAMGLPLRRSILNTDEPLRALKDAGTRMLIIDNMENLCGRPRREQLILTATMKYLTNELEAPIACAGRPEAWPVLKANPEIVSRLHFVTALPNWKEGPDYYALLTAFERQLPLQRESRLAEPTLAAEILKATDGIIGAIARLLKAAAVIAIERGSEQIGLQELGLAVSKG
jgi:hypothetical protein